MRRSMLFLPGNNPNMLINSGSLGADAVIFDLEDAVSPDQKDAARILVRNTLKYMDLKGCERIVRINSIDTPYWKKDIDTVAPFAPELILLPKTGTAEDVRTACAYITQVEQQLGLKENAIGLMPLIETALGVENAFAIASADPRVQALFLGAEDLTADLQCKRTKEGQEIAYARSRLVTAARAAGVDVYDTPFTDVNDDEGIEVDTAYAKALGLGEKTGIELAGEQAGVVAGPAYTASVGGTWYEGSVLSAAIGQENHRFTPVQLAHMTATLVSGGERRQVHLLKQVAGEEAQEAVSLGKIALSEKNLTAIKEGMRRVVQSGSLAEAFRDLPVTAGAKTGSAQVAGEEEANAVLVCFAPYDVPKIALALVAEQGGSGAALGDAAAAILNTWAAGSLS